ncbi:MAG TPA: hypothetical protein VMC42_00400 [Methanoregulaceae archaeon]|nr:hypothetical protein [Methanoregulaceae archaeon]
MYECLISGLSGAALLCHKSNPGWSVIPIGTGVEYHNFFFVTFMSCQPLVRSIAR